MPNDDAIIEGILKSLVFIHQFKGEMNRETFAGDARTWSAVYFQLMLVAGEIRRLSSAFKDRHSEVNWHAWAALQDRLARSAAGAEAGEVWKFLDTEMEALAGLASKVPRHAGAPAASAPAPARAALSNTGELIRRIKDQFRLEWEGEHGIYHFWAVRETGLWLAPRTGALPDVVEAFSLLHDACRQDDYEDDIHAENAAALAEQLKDLLGMDPAAFRLLKEAILKHHLGILTREPTLGTCWDADHLDIGRIGGAVPEIDKLNTKAARDRKVMEWAYKRSRGEKADPPSS